MKLPVLTSPAQDVVILPEKFIREAERLDLLQVGGPRLLYKAYHKDRLLVVSPREYREEEVIYLPRELIEFLKIEEGDKINVARFLSRLNPVKSLRFRPLDTNFYRFADVRGLIESTLMNIPVLHKGVIYSISSSKLELVELTTTTKQDETQGLVVGDQEIELDFAPNDELHSQYLRELEAEKKTVEDSRYRKWREILEFRKRGGLVFGMSQELLDYSVTFAKESLTIGTSEQPSRWQGVGRRLR